MVEISFTLYRVGRSKEIGGIANVDGGVSPIRDPADRPIHVRYMGVCLYVMETHLLVYSMVDIYKGNMKGWRIGDRMPPSAFATLENITYLCSFLDQSPPVKLRGLGQKEMERIIKDFDIRVRDATPGCPKTPYR